jgi:uncharacterized protein YbaA (DUF1428 family)
MTYVDGFVLCVPTKKLKDYKKVAQGAAKIWMKHGALQYKETVADDVGDTGFCTTFPQLAKPKKDETVVFSFIVYKSRAHRDAVNKKVMADPKLKEGCEKVATIFDCKRMAYGGFKTIVEF